MASLATFAVGLALLALLSTYDLRHWDAVTAPSRNYTTNDNGAGIALFGVMTYALVLVPTLTIVAVVVLTIAMLRGKYAARGVTIAVTCAYLLCCGARLPSWRERGDPDRSNDVLVVTYDRTAPIWVHVADASAVYLIFGGALLATTVLFLPATRRALRQRGEPPAVRSKR